MTMLDYLPFDDNGARGKCTSTNKNEWGITPCEVDDVATVSLAILWSLYTAILAYYAFNPARIRPTWESLENLESISEKLEIKLTGNKRWFDEDSSIMDSCHTSITSNLLSDKSDEYKTFVS